MYTISIFNIQRHSIGLRQSRTYHFSCLKSTDAQISGYEQYYVFVKKVSVIFFFYILFNAIDRVFNSSASDSHCVSFVSILQILI